MVEILKALQELNVCWKKNGHYNMKCRWCLGAPDIHDMLDVNNSFLGDSTNMDKDDANGRLPAVIKFEMQVFGSCLHCLNFVCHEYILDI
jgi:5'-AMP-activated protein kinase, catalytic alpha subunit